MTLLLNAAIALSLGVVSHLSYFIRGEHNRAAPQWFLFSLFGPGIAAVAFHRICGLSLQGACLQATVLFCSFGFGLFGSMAIYRAFLHRLNPFPGPFGAKLSKFWMVGKVAKRLDFHQQLDALHKQYGEVVRTGPCEVSISDPAAVDIVHGPRSRCTKSIFYEMDYPATQLSFFRERADHDRRKRGGWNTAFNPGSLRSYESTVVSYADQLAHRIATTPQPIDMTQWSTFYTLDVMGELAFGRPFDALKTGKTHYLVEMLHAFVIAVAYLGHVPYVLQVIANLTPAVVNPIIKFTKYSEDCLADRARSKTGKPDIMTHIIDGEPFYQDPERERLLRAGDSRSIVGAGVDTTATTLSFCVYHLAKDPLYQKQILEELKASQGPNSNIQLENLKALPYLNGFINECLRLQPPLPGGVPRLTPAEGITIGETDIPGDVTVLTPIYTIQRSSKAFVQPNELIPERWSTRSDLIKDRNAFFPFLIGPFHCIGKQLAYMQLRAVLAKLVSLYEISFPPGEDGTHFLGNAKDGLILCLPPLPVVFTKRQ